MFASAAANTGERNFPLRVDRERENKFPRKRDDRPPVNFDIPPWRITYFAVILSGFIQRARKSPSSRKKCCPRSTGGKKKRHFILATIQDDAIKVFLAGFGFETEFRIITRAHSEKRGSRFLLRLADSTLCFSLLLFLFSRFYVSSERAWREIRWI